MPARSVRFVFRSVDVLRYSRAEPMDDQQQQKTAQGPQVLIFHFGCQSPPSQPFLRGITDFQALLLSLSTVFYQFVGIW